MRKTLNSNAQHLIMPADVMTVKYQGQVALAGAKHYQLRWPK